MCNHITHRATTNQPFLDDAANVFLNGKLLRPESDKYYISVQHDLVEFTNTKKQNALIDRFIDEGITACVVSNSSISDTKPLATETDGLFFSINIYEYAETVADFIIDKHGYKKPLDGDYRIITAAGWKTITLDAPITEDYEDMASRLFFNPELREVLKDSYVDTDNDSLLDLEEIRFDWLGTNSEGKNVQITWDEYGNVVLPTFSDCMESKDDLFYMNNVIKGMYPYEINLYGNFRILPIFSDPTLADSDYDGIDDTKDKTPLENVIYTSLTSQYSVNKEKKDEFHGEISYSVDMRDFFKPETKYNPKLSTFASVLATTAYSSNDKRTIEYNGDLNADGVLKLHGFDEDKTFDYDLRWFYGDSEKRPHFDDVHVSKMYISHKDLEYNSAKKTVIAIVIEGTEGSIEQWTSNFDLGSTIEYEAVKKWRESGYADTSDFDNTLNYWLKNNNKRELYSYSYWRTPENHKGFDIVANRFKDYIDKYIKEYCSDVNKDDMVFFVTGHSRGVAAANILSAYLIDDGKKVSAYTFACSGTTTNDKANDSSYDSIFNIVNADDFVPMVPMNAWHFKRYGKTADEYCICDYYEREWESIMLKSYGGKIDYNPDTHDDLIKTVDALAEIAKDANGHYNRNNCYIFTCECHGDGSFGKETTTFYFTEDIIPENAKPFYCSEENGIGYYICQTPAYFMQLVAAVSSDTQGKLNFQFASNISNRYEKAKGKLVLSKLSGINHPHYLQSYYILSKHIASPDFK